MRPVFLQVAVGCLAFSSLSIRFVVYSRTSPSVLWRPLARIWFTTQYSPGDGQRGGALPRKQRVLHTPVGHDRLHRIELGGAAPALGEVAIGLLQGERHPVHHCCLSLTVARGYDNVAGRPMTGARKVDEGFSLGVCELYVHAT